MKTLALICLAACVVAGTLATANVRRTAVSGAQLPNRVLVEAFADDDATLVQRMRDYVKGLSRR